MKEIVLSGGERCQVSDEDFDFAYRSVWTRRKRDGYVQRRTSTKNFLLHIEIAKRAGWNFVQLDHVDGNKLNNQRTNLRPCTPSQNAANRRKRDGCISEFKGVSLSRPRAIGAWRASITHHGVTMSLGTFATEEEAARAYDRMAARMFGTFARLNFPPKTPGTEGDSNPEKP